MAGCAFISGHVDIDNTTFLEHYKESLDNAISNNDHFVIGNANGVDTMALEYLIEQKVDSDKITIYFYSKYEKEDKYRTMGLNIKTGFTSYTSRDKEMTINSDYDIAWVRSADESKTLYGNKYDPKKKSGTQLNLERRQKLKKS